MPRFIHKSSAPTPAPTPHTQLLPRYPSLAAG